MTLTSLAVDGDIVRRGDAEYESHRRVGWSSRIPDRYPEAIVLATSVADVVAVVDQARQEGVRVAIRSRGHHWTATSLRDGGVLLDLSQLAGVEVDAERRTASVGPGVRGADLSAALAPHGLAFPVGHCADVPMGGFLLSGGLGLNWGKWKPACFSVDAVEVVTADGRVVVADEANEPDLLWLARGSGPGFPGVVTRFDLALHPLPEATTSSTFAFRYADAPDVLAWVADVDARLPVEVELSTFLAGPRLAGLGEMLGLTEHAAIVTASAFAHTEAEAQDALAPLHACPLADRAIASMLGAPTPFATLADLTGTVLPEGHRYAVDAQWSSAPTVEVLADLLDHFAQAPSELSCVNNIMLPDAGSGFPRPGAYSMDRRTISMVYALWERPEDDAANREWLREAMRLLEPHATGRYLAEGDPCAGASRVPAAFDAESWRRIEALRLAHDPDRLFHGYLTETM